MTIFLVCAAGLTGLIAGFCIGISIADWAITEQDNPIFKEAGYKFVNGKWTLPANKEPYHLRSAGSGSRGIIV